LGVLQRPALLLSQLARHSAGSFVIQELQSVVGASHQRCTKLQPSRSLIRGRRFISMIFLARFRSPRPLLDPRRRLPRNHILDQMSGTGKLLVATRSFAYLPAGERCRFTDLVALLIDGLFDLLPFRSSISLKGNGVADNKVRLFTPTTDHHDPACPVTIAVGELETLAFHAQAAAFTGVLRQQGLRVNEVRLSDKNHMSIVRDVGVPGTEAADLLSSIIQTPRNLRRSSLPIPALREAPTIRFLSDFPFPHRTG